MNITKYDLSTKELMMFQSEMKSKEKSLGLAYLMLIGGHLGVHRFYLKRNGTAIAQLLLFVLSIIFYVALIISIEAIEIMNEPNYSLFILSIILFLICVLPLTIWIIIDLFRMPRMVREWNEREEKTLLQQIVELREQS